MILLAACGGKTSPALTGEWVMMDGSMEFPQACGSHGPITYTPDGKYSIWGEAGTWRLDGEALTETMTGFDPMHMDRMDEDIGKPVASTLRWLDPDRFSKLFADGSVREFRRCPGRD